MQNESSRLRMTTTTWNLDLL